MASPAPVYSRGLFVHGRSRPPNVLHDAFGGNRIVRSVRLAWETSGSLIPAGSNLPRCFTKEANSAPVLTPKGLWVLRKLG